MLDYLELLMLKASSYSWSSVRSFHSHITRQIELWRLEWPSSNEIRDKAVTFFKHSDLHSDLRFQCQSGLVSHASVFFTTASTSRTRSGKIMSSMELLWLVFLQQVKSRCLQRPSQMSRLYQRSSHVALSEKEKSDPAPKLCLTTGFGSTNTSGCFRYGQSYG